MFNERGNEMTTTTKPATPLPLTVREPYFTDQYGHIYRWQNNPEGAVSISVANFQKYGDRKESDLLVEEANSVYQLRTERAELVAALRSAVEMMEDWGPNDDRSKCVALLAKLGEGA